MRGLVWVYRRQDGGEGSKALCPNINAGVCHAGYRYGMLRGQAAPFRRDGRLAQPGRRAWPVPCRMRACTGIPHGQTGLGGMIQGLLDWGVGGGGGGGGGGGASRPMDLPLVPVPSTADGPSSRLPLVFVPT